MLSLCVCHTPVLILWMTSHAGHIRVSWVDLGSAKTHQRRWRISRCGQWGISIRLHINMWAFIVPKLSWPTLYFEQQKHVEFESLPSLELITRSGSHTLDTIPWRPHLSVAILGLRISWTVLPVANDWHLVVTKLIIMQFNTAKSNVFRWHIVDKTTNKSIAKETHHTKFWINFALFLFINSSKQTMVNKPTNQ